MVSVGGGCEAAVISDTGCGWFMLSECGELLYGRRFPLKLKSNKSFFFLKIKDNNNNIMQKYSILIRIKHCT